MTQEERASLAEQIIGNPLFAEILADMERVAIDRCVYAPIVDNEMRSAAAAEVRAIRTFRSNCQAALDNNRARKGAPA